MSLVNQLWLVVLVTFMYHDTLSPTHSAQPCPSSGHPTAANDGSSEPSADEPHQQGGLHTLTMLTPL